MPATRALRSWGRPVVNARARSLSSRRRWMYASTSSSRASSSGRTSAEASSTLPVRETSVIRARTSPSTTIWIAAGPFAIWRMTPTVPTPRIASGPGSSVSPACWTSSTRRSPPSARFTESTDTGRLTASGWSVSGKTTVPRRGMTGSLAGSGGTAEVERSDMDQAPRRLTWLAESPAGRRRSPSRARRRATRRTPRHLPSVSPTGGG